MSEMMDAITGIGTAFEEFKKVNDQRLDEERKGNEARAKELAATLEKVTADLSEHRKQKELLDRSMKLQQERIEIMESLNERPRMSVQDKIKAEHHDNFLKWVRTGDQGLIKAQDDLRTKARELKDVSIGDTAAGGYAVSEQIAREVNTLVFKLSAIAQEVKTVEANTSDYKELLTVLEQGMYGWVGETTSRTGTTEPYLRERAPSWGAQYAVASATNWSLQDIFFNVESWLTTSIAEGISQGLSTAIYSGNGSNRPLGMTNTALSTSDDYSSPMRNAAAFQYEFIRSAGSSPFTTVGITADAINKTIYKLNPRYRGNAKFAMNTVTQGNVMTLKDTTNQYLWQPSLQAGQPDRLRGYPVFTWEDLGNSTSSGAYAIAFGDFKQAYVLVRRPTMEIIRDQVTSKGNTLFYIEQRVGGCVLNNDALKFTKCSLS